MRLSGSRPEMRKGRQMRKANQRNPTQIRKGGQKRMAQVVHELDVGITTTRRYGSTCVGLRLQARP